MEDENKPKKKKDRFEITEMFMAQCGKDKWSQCYYGVINREKDGNGKEIAVNSHVLAILCAHRMRMRSLIILTCRKCYLYLHSVSDHNPQLNINNTKPAAGQNTSVG